MADLVGGELAEARERHSQHGGSDGLPALVGREQALGDQVVLPDAQRTERDLALDDLAGARIDDGCRRRTSRAWSGGPTG